MSSLAQRTTIVRLIDDAVQRGASCERACSVVGIAPSTLRRWRTRDGVVKEDARPKAHRAEQANRLSEQERQEILTVCNRAEFASLPPSQIVPILADRGEYVGSESTIYRVLKAHGQLNHRGRAKKRQQQPPARTHVANAVNQVWMLDVTWLPSRVKGQFFYLYMVEDLFSRYGVHWEVFEEVSSEHTCQVIEQSMWREKCLLSPPILHRDNGSVLKSQTVLQKMNDLGIRSSHSRPRVSNDNAFVESMFRTLKYSPSWPSQGFENIEAAREWTSKFMHWYNNKHRHSALKFVTPAQRHKGEDIEILEARKMLYEEVRSKYPKRWSGPARNWKRETTVTLNPEKRVESMA